ncbi:MAG TPA: cystathionine beta-lyase [Devosia sp.]|nr:cystathionine beta-lyase [Devosia sp.]
MIDVCDNMGEATQLIHGARISDSPFRTPVPLVQRGSTILLGDSACFGGGSGLPTYGRSGLATQTALRSALADLEHAEEAHLYPSGLAAITGTIMALTCSGDEILLSDSVYNPTRRFVDNMMSRYGVTARYFEPDASGDRIEAMIGEKTRLIFLESPGSLTLDMQDVPAIATIARRKGVLTAIDNTYSAGVFFKPIDYGVDVSIQSLTKYVCGHSDVFMGMAAASGEAAALLAKGVGDVGWAVSPDDAYLALRGLKTLHGRLGIHEEAVNEVALWLEQQPEVVRVLCPMLESHPGHNIWRRDFSGACGLVTIVLDGDQHATGAFLDALRLIGLGFSWGGFESLAIPCDDQLRKRTHPRDWGGAVIRLHIGMEQRQDVKTDLRRGLDAFVVARCANNKTMKVPGGRS